MSGGEVAAWIAVGLAVLAIVVAIAVAMWQRQRRELTYEAYSEFPLFVPGPVSRDVEISANGHKLRLPHVLIVILRNSGNAALRPEDFYEPIRVKFNDADLITLNLDASPSDLSVTGEVESPREFRVDPTLLNPGEGIACYALMDGCPHAVKVTSRIADAALRDASRPSFSESLLAGVSVRLGVGPFGISIGNKASLSRRVPATRTVDPSSRPDPL